MLWTAKSCSASRKIRSLRPFAPRRERPARNTSSTVAQSSSVIRVSMVGSSQTDLPGVTDPRTWESTHRILDPIRPHSLAQKGDLAVLSYLPYQAGERTGLIAECALAIVTQVFRDLCGPDWALAEVSMPRRAPADQSPYRFFFRSDVWFGQETAALVFPAGLLSTRLTGCEGEVRRALEHKLRRAETNVRPDLIEDLRQMLRTEMRSGRCSANGMARQLALHERTLKRHLKAAGTSFRAVADEVRFEVARHLVVDTNMPLVQISAVLDFSEPAAFTRAFQRWSGVSPSLLRSQQKAISPEL